MALLQIWELNPTSANLLAVLTKDYNADMREIRKVIRKRMNLSDTFAYPIIYGVAKPTYSAKELEEMKEHAEEKHTWKGKELTGYECTQEQRRMETEIRKSQDRERALRRAGDTQDARKSARR